ncbi:MAG TPA: GAF domain-containing protein [Tepidisphaeraceae bacterium]|nr:GAF domain-containing protein [Tepidisphaeraceae bacterium]
MPKPKNEATRLIAVHDTQLLDTPPDPDFDGIAELAAAICRTPMAMISLVDSDRQWFKAKVGLSFCQTPRKHAFCAQTICGTEPFIVEDASLDPRTRDNPYVTREPYLRFYAGIPLIDSAGNALGSLCVLDTQPRRLSDDQIEHLQTLARATVTRIEVDRLTRWLLNAITQ